MRRLLKWCLIVLAWLVVIAALLEGGLRLLADRLPGRLAVGARFALTGERYQTDSVSFMMTDADNGYMLLPDLHDVRRAVSPDVSITLSTISLWGSRFGF